MNNKDLDILIDEALKTAPATSLSDNFAQKVVYAYQERVSIGVYLQQFLWAILVATGVLLVAIAVISFVENSLWQSLQMFLHNHLLTIVSFTIVVLFTFFLNQVCLPYAMRKFIDYQ